MSLVNSLRVPGSSTSTIGRLGIGPPRSGRVANSTKSTLMMPSVALIGVGNGSFGACPETHAPASNTAAEIRVKVIPAYYCLSPTGIYLTLARVWAHQGDE